MTNKSHLHVAELSVIVILSFAFVVFAEKFVIYWVNLASQNLVIYGTLSVMGLLFSNVTSKW
jgi:hypothetical protein